MQSAIYFDEKLEAMPQSHLKGLVALVRRVWDPEATVASYMANRSAAFHGNPFARRGGIPLSILIDGDKVVGHDTAVPCLLWANGVEVMAYYQAGLHIDVEYRGKGLGSILPKLMNASMVNKFGFFVIPQQYRTHLKLGWVLPGKMPEYMRVINVPNFIENLNVANIDQMPQSLKKLISSSRYSNALIFKTIPSALLWLWNTACDGWRKRALPPQYYRYEWPTRFDERIDSLWLRVRNRIAYTQVRHSEYLNWHFPKDRGWKYLTVYRKEVLLGFAILYTKKFPVGHKLSGMKVTTIIDLFWDFDQPNTLAAIIDRCIRHATENNADVLLTGISHRGAQKQLFVNGFLPIPPTVHFTCHSSDPSINFSSNMSKWYLTRGIADGAGSLGAN